MKPIDVVVIGAGPAGVFAACRAADLGAKTALVTRNEFGGMAAHDGPVPVRTLEVTAVAVCMRVEFSLMVRCRATIVVTAITWSGSVAWRIPRKKPKATIGSKPIMFIKDAPKPTSECWFKTVDAPFLYRLGQRNPSWLGTAAGRPHDLPRVTRNKIAMHDSSKTSSASGSELKTLILRLQG